MKAPEEFKRSVYEKQTAAREKSRRNHVLAVGIAIPAFVMFFCLGVWVFREKPANMISVAQPSGRQPDQTTDLVSICAEASAGTAVLPGSKVSESFSLSSEPLLATESSGKFQASDPVLYLDCDDGFSVCHRILSNEEYTRLTALLDQLQGEPAAASQSAVWTLTIGGNQTNTRVLRLSDSAFCREDGIWRTADPALLRQILTAGVGD